MCKEETCPIKLKCQRYTCNPNAWQNYLRPALNKLGNSCIFFLDNGKFVENKEEDNGQRIQQK